MKIKNSNVLITGGASGIGKIMGRMALEKGAKCVIIWDINQQNIATTIEEFSPLGKVKGYRVDVGDIEIVRIAYATTVKECGDIDILINNAGIITSNKTFDEVDISEIDRTMLINAIAPMYVARVMLPDMLRRGVGTSVTSPRQVVCSAIPVWRSMVPASGQPSGGPTRYASNCRSRRVLCVSPPSPPTTSTRVCSMV